MNRILLLEDDEALALGIEFTLKDEGFNVTRCASVEEAIDIFNKNKFDLLILDVMLPDGNGYDICKYVRGISKVPIIFLTACDDEVNVILGLDIGADDYITKPFRVRELISRIKAIQRRFKSFENSKNIFKCKDLILNTETAKLENKGEEVILSAQEYKLILIFMTNAKKVMTREEILNKLMEGEGAYFDTNTLSVYIKRIRDKIEEDSSKPEYIKTKRGIGYEWNPEVEKE
ncbi:DNA-binding response regulator [Clostridium tetani]|uniref:Stage 0 sporulation protein A homolog n=1 Tax=Clostridium tetani TaxID=1513 RepID=A0A4Q0VD54_CLOTA|nr:response regulator transcription factor [Clostridium tetani]RXI49886.1 DNA-binding response regulator [Clostridium tetani]BDR67592.1 DNA-binding response regulator [Clostridium tetani]BDR72982.1 DNA-binding response regulator [Clostridium tetani]BDR81525.1 DNA-binding response regulator [Clostridium tetani]BDR89906.1 DNA-binding response regulator [Clostridium tetani]